MADRPILFQGPMVRALLAGTKTQTRRVVKGIKQPGHTGAPMSHAPDEAYLLDGGPTWRFDYLGGVSRYDVVCPYGQPGDRLWVRESHWWFKDEHDPVTGYFPPKLTAEDVKYRADGEKPGRIWRPSIHMPRWASRITLEITGVRVERLQDISEADAIAEGGVQVASGWWSHDGTTMHTPGDTHFGGTAVDSYRLLWDQINGHGSWDANPWVWCVEFNRVMP